MANSTPTPEQQANFRLLSRQANDLVDDGKMKTIQLHEEDEEEISTDEDEILNAGNKKLNDENLTIGTYTNNHLNGHTNSSKWVVDKDAEFLRYARIKTNAKKFGFDKSSAFPKTFDEHLKQLEGITVDRAVEMSEKIKRGSEEKMSRNYPIDGLGLAIGNKSCCVQTPEASGWPSAAALDHREKELQRSMPPPLSYDHQDQEREAEMQRLLRRRNALEQRKMSILQRMKELGIQDSDDDENELEKISGAWDEGDKQVALSQHHEPLRNKRGLSLDEDYDAFSPRYPASGTLEVQEQLQPELKGFTKLEPVNEPYRVFDVAPIQGRTMFQNQGCGNRGIFTGLVNPGQMSFVNAPSSDSIKPHDQEARSGGFVPSRPVRVSRSSSQYLDVQHKYHPDKQRQSFQQAQTNQLGENNQQARAKAPFQIDEQFWTIPHQSMHELAYMTDLNSIKSSEGTYAPLIQVNGTWYMPVNTQYLNAQYANFQHPNVQHPNFQHPNAQCANAQCANAQYPNVQYSSVEYPNDETSVAAVPSASFPIAPSSDSTYAGGQFPMVHIPAVQPASAPHQSGRVWYAQHQRQQHQNNQSVFYQGQDQQISFGQSLVGQPHYAYSPLRRPQQGGNQRGRDRRSRAQQNRSNPALYNPQKKKPQNSKSQDVRPQNSQTQNGQNQERQYQDAKSQNGRSQEVRSQDANSQDSRYQVRLSRQQVKSSDGSGQK